MNFKAIIKNTMIALAVIASASCTKELSQTVVPNGMKLVTMKAKTVETKASIDNDGTFAWQAGDQISVLATDNKFYVLTLKGENGVVFEGLIPETAEITSVATYPAIFENGSANTAFDKATGILNFNMPETYEHQISCTNVPMVATFAEGAAMASFKQVGALVKYTFQNVPAKVKFVAEFDGKNVTGSFPFDTAKLGEEGIVATDLEGSSSKVTVNYEVEEATPSMTLYVPVPTGTYSKFSISAYDVENGTDEMIYSKSYEREGGYSMTRGKMFNTKDILVNKLVIDKVRPFYSDAKVTWIQLPDVTGYAIFVDGDLTAPYKTVSAENKNTNFGEFELNTEHSVQVAPMYGDEVSISTISDPVTFTTGNIAQIADTKYNTGATLVSVKMSDQTKTSDAAPGANNRVYYVQLFASEDVNSTPVYEGYTFDYQSQSASKGPFGASSWIAKVGGTNQSSPEINITMGGLEPGHDYYFRAKTIAETKLFGESSQSNITVKSSAGESAYSPLVKLSTEPAHVAGSNEVIFEPFDDITLNTDYINMAAGLTPHYTSLTSQSDFKTKVTNLYTFPWAPETIAVPTFQAPNTTLTMPAWGLVADDNLHTRNTGSSLVGWTSPNWIDMKPQQGYMLMGTAVGPYDIPLQTPALEANLPEDAADAVICNVSFKACPIATTYIAATTMRVDVLVPLPGGNYYVAKGTPFEITDLTEYTDANNYTRHFEWGNYTKQVKLAKGFKVQVVVVSNSNTRQICVDDILVEVDPTATSYDGPDIDPNNAEGVVTYVSEANQGTDYDAYKLKGTGIGDFALGVWYTPPYLNNEWYNPLKELGLNTLVMEPYVASTFETNSWVLDFCHENRMKYVGYSGWGEAPETQTRILGNMDLYAKKYMNDEFNPYIGTYVSDEPSVTEFKGFSAWASFLGQQEYYKDIIPYVNLFPSYAKTSQLGTETYEEYVDKWMEHDNIKSVSVDFYAYVKGNHTDIRNDYFYNLDIIRKKTLDKGLQFVTIVQNYNSKGSFLQMRRDEYRWQVWAAIAFGSKGISYFLYYDADHSDDINDYGWSLRTMQNTPGIYWDFCKDVNKTITDYLASELIDCHADGVIQNTQNPLEVYETRYSYGPLKSVSGDNSLVGCLRDDKTGEYKLFITQHRTTNNENLSTTVKLHLDETVTGASVITTTDGSKNNVNVASDHTITLTIPAGEADLVTLKF